MKPLRVDKVQYMAECPAGTTQYLLNQLYSNYQINDLQTNKDARQQKITVDQISL
ncbi:hypothetical protein GCM10028819_40550 [Spirosoma humi]